MKRTTKILALFTLFLTPFISLAHVRYIANDSDVSEFGGVDFEALLAPLSNPLYIFLILGTIVFGAVAYWFLDHNKYFHTWSDHMAKVGESYKMFVPWMVRLSLGIAFLGAGTTGYFMSPVLVGNEVLSFIQILLGFFLMAGILVGPSAVAALFLFFYALAQDVYLIGAFDMLALIFSLLILDSRRPGIDDIIGIPDFTHIKPLRAYLGTILRGGVGIAMAYLAVYEKILNPHLSAFVVEVTDLVNVIPVTPLMWTFAAGVIELIIGIALIIGLKTRLVCVIALLVLSMSFFYFGESVTSHVTLFGILAIVFILGPGKGSVDNWMHKKYHKREVINH